MTNRSIFYGWWVVAAFSAMTFMSTGVRHAVGPFLKPIVADLGLDRASFSAVIALSLFLYGVFMPIAGLALDRFSVRVVTSVGTVVLVISLVLTAMVHNVWEFAVVYGVLVPLGLAGTGPVIASGVVARWFSKRRGTALSVLGSASMTGMSLLVPAVTWLIITTGWRTTYMLIAAGILVVVLPLCLWVVRDSPESMGLTADGTLPTTGAGAIAIERVSTGEALQTLAFWQLAGSFFTCGFSMSLLSAHGIPMLTDHGYSPTMRTWASSRDRRLGHRVHGDARRAVRPFGPPARARRHLCRPGLHLCRLLPHPRQSRRDPHGGRPRRHHDGGHRLDDLGADRRHLRALLRQLGLRPDLPRAPDGLRHRLRTRRSTVRDHRRLRRGLRGRVLLPRGRIDRGAQHRQGRAADLARRHRLGNELTDDDSNCSARCRPSRGWGPAGRGATRTVVRAAGRHGAGAPPA